MHLCHFPNVLLFWLIKKSVQNDINITKNTIQKNELDKSLQMLKDIEQQESEKKVVLLNRLWIGGKKGGSEI